MDAVLITSLKVCDIVASCLRFNIDYSTTVDLKTKSPFGTKTKKKVKKDENDLFLSLWPLKYKKTWRSIFIAKQLHVYVLHLNFENVCRIKPAGQTLATSVVWEGRGVLRTRTARTRSRPWPTGCLVPDAIDVFCMHRTWQHGAADARTARRS